MILVLQVNALCFDAALVTFTCSKLTIETLEEGLKYIQS